MAAPNVGVSTKPGGSDVAPPLSDQLEALELALKALHAIGRALVLAPRSTFDLRPAALAAEKAITCALDGYDGRRDTSTALVEAVSFTEDLEAELRNATSVDAGLAEAVDWAKTAAGWLRKALGSPSSGRMPLPSPLIASVTSPSLHAPVRPTLVPSFAVAGPLPPPAPPPDPIDPALPAAARLSIVRERAAARKEAAEARREAWAAARAASRQKPPPEPPPGFVVGPHAAISAEAAIRKKARDCFEDVAALGMMRAPLLGDDWRNMVSLEQRLFAALDAIVGLGPHALSALESFVIDAPAKDPTRGFAAAMVCGSLAGRDALAVAERALAHLGAKVPENAEAFAEGLVLAPNPDIFVVMRRWLEDEDSALRAIAIDVLSRRGLATPNEIEKALGDDEPNVIAKALVPAAISLHPALARRAEELFEQTHEDVSRELAWAMVLGDTPFAVSRLRTWLGTPKEADALLPIALAGERDDIEALVDLTIAKATRPRVTALGFAGSVRSIATLIDLLRTAKDDELKLTTAFALQRLTDAPLFDNTTIAPEKIDVPEPDEPDDPAPAARPLAKRVADSRDLPADGSADAATLPTTDPERWKAFLASREAYAEQLKLRRGKPYTAATTLIELSDAPLVPFERRVLHRELVIRTGEALAFDPAGFVATQQRELDAWATPARRASMQLGSWIRPRRRPPA